MQKGEREEGVHSERQGKRIREDIEPKVQPSKSQERGQFQ